MLTKLRQTNRLRERILVVGMSRIEIYGLRVAVDINTQTDLPKLIVEEAEKKGCGIVEGDVIVVTSKVVSKAEDRVHRLGDVRPSRRAYLLSRIYRTQPEAMELYLREGEIRLVIPVEKLSRMYGHLYERYASS
jgi:F420-0:gamma-glutamyl ligase